jgi:hypothetical protein
MMIRTIDFDDFCDRSYRQGRSQFRFARLHPDPEVRRYCEIDGALSAWAVAWRDYAGILRHARGLDRLATIRLDAGLGLPFLLQTRLDAAYRHVFFLSRAKGLADAAGIAETIQSEQENRIGRAYGLSHDVGDILTTFGLPRQLNEHA